ncbi:MAG: ABC transporter substrate-binding protein [Promethearchaeota archaeon]|jgi:peptide/nickel transport system substrate-binding protein
METGENKTRKKIPKKKRSFKDNKKTIVAGGIVSVIAIAGIISGFYFLETLNTTEEGGNIYFGISFNLGTFDPIEVFLTPQTIDSSHFLILSQVLEGLFYVRVTDEGTEIIPNLAINRVWSEDGLNLTCDLRPNVKFHDGTPFNATAVKWNIERIHRLFNNSWYPDLWQFPDGQWIINDTQIIDDLSIRFVLNKPYAPLLALLASESSLIVSPTSTPENDYNDINNNRPVGTSAFIFEHWEEDDNITLSSNALYWDGKPRIDNLIFSIIPNNTVRLEAMLSKELTITYTGFYYHDIYITEPGLTLQEVTNSVNRYIFMNNKIINTTMRKAISYAFNYSFFLEEIFRGLRCRSPLPKEFMYSNWDDFVVPDYNISIARQTLKDAGLSGTNNLTVNNNISAGNEWETIANGPTPLATYNFTYTYGNWVPEQISFLLKNNLKQIGIKLEVYNITWAEWEAMVLEYGGYHRDMLNIFYMGIGPDYSDPSTMITPVFSNKGPNYNFGQVNNTQLQQWIEMGIVELNETAREQIYYDIQKLLIEELFPVLWLHTEIFWEVFLSNLRGINYQNLATRFNKAYFV